MINTLFIAVIIFFSAMAHSAECIVIKNDKSGAGFLNGVFVSKDEAPIAIAILSKRIGKQVELYYNHTEGLIFDLMEAFDQRIAESRACTANSTDMACGAPIELAGRYELMHSHFQRQVAVNQNAAKALERFNRDAIAIKSRYAAAPITKKDYAEHERILRQQLKDNSKVVLFAHSQGNLFANRLYEVLSSAQQRRTALIHIAPASIKLHGGYVLSDEDVVILGLPLARPPTFDASFSFSDWSGHKFIESYLNSNEAFRQINRLYTNEVNQRRGITGFFNRQSKTLDGRYSTVGWAQLNGDRGYWGNYSNACRGTMTLLPDPNDEKAMVWLTQADAAGLCQQSNGSTRIELGDQNTLSSSSIQAFGKSRLPFTWVSSTRQGLQSSGMMTCTEMDPRVVATSVDIPVTQANQTVTGVTVNPPDGLKVSGSRDEVNAEVNRFLKNLPTLMVK